MTSEAKFNNANLFAGAKTEHPPSRTGSTPKPTPASPNGQAELTKKLVTAAQNGDSSALEKLCIFYEPLFKKEMRREIFYNALGYEEGLSLARLKFIEIVMGYNGADFEHFAGYVRCRVHYALYDAVKKIWQQQNNEAALPCGDDADLPTFADNAIEREELAILLALALKKLTEKQRNTIKAMYFDGYSGKEIATKLKITPAMVSKHHKQALKNLRSNIA